MKLCKDCKFYRPSKHADFDGEHAKCAYPLRSDVGVLVGGEGKVDRYCLTERGRKTIGFWGTVIEKDSCGREARWWVPA